MWYSYEQKKPKEEQRIHAIGYFEGEIVGETTHLVEGIGYYSSETGGIDLESDTYCSAIYKILFWKTAGKLPDEIVEDSQGNLTLKDK